LGFKLAIVLGLLLAAPAHAEVNTALITDKRPPRALSEFGFFTDMASVIPDPALAPYEISSPLFTDYADKSRYIFTPAPVEPGLDGPLAFPVGSALIKTFSYGSVRVETRVMMHKETGWVGYAYVWNEDQTDASLKIAGADLQLETEYGTINYRVPNANQCKACHVGPTKAMQPIGPKIRNLNMGDQLATLQQAGVLAFLPDNAPAVPNYSDNSVSLEQRARAYLDANCAHCHAPGLPADTSGLYLNWEEDRPVHIGIGKKPVAAGRGSGGLLVDIAPGDPDASIMIFRMNSTDPGIMMPEIGRSMIHDEGLSLIRAYIEALEE
jgi:uncharacterized repeat protein (TIGR03806 family)